jgi:hypothetical protein
MRSVHAQRARAARARTCFSPPREIGHEVAYASSHVASSNEIFGPVRAVGVEVATRAHNCGAVVT